MSLNVCLYGPEVEIPCQCECGHQHTRRRRECYFDANITHNLNRMAGELGIYEACWRPEQIGATKAKDIIHILETGIKQLKSDPEHYGQFNANNGWGTVEQFLHWLEEYLKACKKYPEFIIRVSS